jgi:hypothetical protein
VQVLCVNIFSKQRFILVSFKLSPLYLDRTTNFGRPFQVTNNILVLESDPTFLGSHKRIKGTLEFTDIR